MQLPLFYQQRTALKFWKLMTTKMKMKISNLQKMWKVKTKNIKHTKINWSKKKHAQQKVIKHNKCPKVNITICSGSQRRSMHEKIRKLSANSINAFSNVKPNVSINQVIDKCSLETDEKPLIIMRGTNNSLHNSYQKDLWISRKKA